MIPILFTAEAEPEALIDVNSIPLHDVDDIELLAAGDRTIARLFDTYGLGALTDSISCEVEEERNGEYVLTMEYPVSGVHYGEIELRCIILAKPNYSDSLQAFRIYSMTTPIDGVVRIDARHLSYDLSGVPVLPFTATSAADACQGLIDNAAIDTPFTVNTQIGTIADFKADVPASVRSWFGGKEGSLIDVYGGEWWYDNYICTLKAQRGADRGVMIRYGVNLIDFEQEKNCESTYTGVLPYWADEDGHLVRANIINLVGSFDYRRIMVLDLSTDFEEQPTAEQLTARAESYITANNIGVPKVSITLDWVQISELTDRVELCDTVHVVFEKIGVETSAKVVRVVWDVLKERYSEIEIGEPKATITDTIAGLEQETEKATSSVSTVMLGAIARATAAITGNSGGYVVMHDGDGDGQPDELLIMDTPDIDTATKVWRWNQSGLGYSGSGYNGSFGLAMTADGEIVADYITTGTLNGILIKAFADDGYYATFYHSQLSFFDPLGAAIAYLRRYFVNSGYGIELYGANGARIESGEQLVLESGAGYSTFLNSGLELTATSASGMYLTAGGQIQANATGAIFLVSSDDIVITPGSGRHVFSTGIYNATSSSAANVRVESGGALYRSTASSKRYKHDITDQLDEDPEALYDVRVVQFKYNDDYLSSEDPKYGKDIIGFIAEDVAEAMPGAVDYDDEGRPEMWNVNVVVPSMMKLIQNQKKKIDELEARLERLEARFF